jgi:hypothetical protein
MTNQKQSITSLLEKYDQAFALLDDLVTPESYFSTFQKLSDNYSPTLTVSRVQGPLIEELLAEEIGNSSPLKVDRNLRGSGTIGITIGREPAPIWLSAHGDICSYLTGERAERGYELTPFCMHRARPGRRDAVALDLPRGSGSLDRLVEGVMVTTDRGELFFETDVPDLPLWTRVVHHLPATWNRESDEIHGFIDNQGGSAAMLLAARVLSHLDVNVLLLVNDEEEGPVDKGNQGFSRAHTRLLHRTPHELLPEMVVVTDAHQQENALEAGAPTMFSQGATFTGASSGTRGSVTPPQLLGFLRDLSEELRPRGISLVENTAYVSRSDDVSALLYTQNICLVGFPGAYAHFDRTPFSHCGDLVHLTKTLVVLALIAQDASWRARYL